MNQIPRVTVEPSDGGWLASCGGCGDWLFWQIRRHVVDLEAHNHQKKCKTLKETR